MHCENRVFVFNNLFGSKYAIFDIKIEDIMQ